MSTVQLNDSGLTSDEQRQVLYAFLLRHFPETQPLRERAVDCLVLGALFGTDETSALKLREIQRNLRVGETTAALRLETLRPSVERLVDAGTVLTSTRRFKKVYYLGEAAQRSLADTFRSSSRMFQSAITRMTAGVDSRSLGESERICRRFMSECFARFGRQIAKSVTGDISAEELMARIDPSVAFAEASNDSDCSSEDRGLLYARCVGFLKSSHPEDQRLKLYLTRAYYFASLLELDDGAARDLSRAEFSQSIVYLDTNIVIPTLLGRRDWISTFSEVLSIAQRLAIEVRISGATINEARRVAATRSADLEQVVGKLPEEVIEASRDSFLAAFGERRDETPTLTVSELLAPFDQIRSVMQEYGVVVDESAEEDFDLASDNLQRLRELISKTAEQLRGWPKGISAVDHDCAEFLILEREWDSGKRAFLLTQDRTLIEAGLRYRSPGSRPLHLSFIAFLQSIAPYVTASEEINFVEAFSRLLVDQLPPIEDVFDMRELRLLADVYDDVQQTPPEQLIEAYHYVKRELARQGTTKPAAANLVLGLRKFLANSAEEKARALAAQIEELKAAVHSKDEGMRDLGADAAKIASESREKDAAIEVLLARMETVERGLEIERNNTKELARKNWLAERTRRRWTFGGGVVAALTIWGLSHSVVSGLVADEVIVRRWQVPLRVLIDFIGTLLLIVPAFRVFSEGYVSPRRIRGFRMACVLASAFFVGRGLNIGAVFSGFEAELGALTLIATVVLWLLGDGTPLPPSGSESGRDDMNV